MALSGFFRLFSGRPVHPVGADGRMALSDHLRELRARILKIALILVLGLALSLVFFDQLFDLVNDPYKSAQKALAEEAGEERTVATTSGAAGGLLLYFKLCGLASVVLTSPFWLYQLWAFILPGLHANEKKWSGIFVAVAGPLFFAGVLLGYLTLPKGLEVLIGFTPDGLTNLLEFNGYLTFFSRTLLVFGIAFEIPVFVVMLNLAGVVTGAWLGAHRPWIIVFIFIFAAVATPSADPFSMTFMAIPMVLLFLISEQIARFNDRRKRRRSEVRRPLTRRGLCAVSLPATLRSNVDPFDLPDWLGTREVSWAADSGLRASHLVPGSLDGGGPIVSTATCWGSTGPTRAPVASRRACGTAPTRPGSTGRCCWSRSVVGSPWPSQAPGFTSELVLTALERLAQAVGAEPSSYAVRLRLGD